MYKITFSDQELNKFNIIENESMRKSLMSIYMYLLKLNDKSNTQFGDADLAHLKDATKLNISFRDFLKAYNRSHNKISIKTLKSRIDKLKELGLLIVEKVKNSFVYGFHRFTVNKIGNEKVNTSNVDEPVENTGFPLEEEEHKYSNTKTLVKDIDSNSCTVSATCGTQVTNVTDNFDYENYMQDQEKVTSWEYISLLVEKMFVSMKVKSSWIKGQVIDKLFNNYQNITQKHAVAYIIKAISNARTQSQSNFNKYVLNNNTSSRTTYSRFNDFPQRNYEEAYANIGGIKGLEYALLGW